MSDTNPPAKRRRTWRKVVKWVLIAVIALAVIDVPASYISTGFAKVGLSRPAPTVAASRRRGALIHELAITPPVVEREGQRVVFKEVWLEHQAELVQVYSIIPCLWEHREYKIVDGYHLCFTLSEGKDAFSGVDSLFVTTEGGESAGQADTVVMFTSFEVMPQFPLKLHLTDNWQLRGSTPLIADRVTK